MTEENTKTPSRSILAFILALAGFLIVTAANLLPYIAAVPELNKWVTFGITIAGIILVAVGGWMGKEMNSKGAGIKGLNTAAFILEVLVLVIIVVSFILSFFIQ